MLHTRSTKYGRLSQGKVVRVPAELVRRQRHHFQQLESVGVDIILGCNGLIWITSHAQQAQPGTGINAGNEEGQQIEKPEPTPVQREAVARVAQGILALSRLGLGLQGASIGSVVQLSLEQNVETKFMLESDFLSAIASQEELQRQEGVAMET